MENSKNNDGIKRIVLKEDGDIPWHLHAYLRSPRCSLYDAYKRPSEAKQAAWKHCEEWRAACGGQVPKICSYNMQRFTYGFITGIIGSRDEWPVPDSIKEHSLVFVYITSARETHYLVPINMMNRAVDAAMQLNKHIHRF